MDWLCMHQCSFMLEKFWVMGMTWRRELGLTKWPATRPVEHRLVMLRGFEIPVIMTHKFLGVIFNQELRWKDHVNYPLTKGTRWVTQYRRLAKVSGSVSAKYMCRSYMTVAVPRMLYAADIFLVPQSKCSGGTRGYIRKLARIQRQATLHITGAM